MRFGHFFIDRPIFAAVVSIVTVVIGLVALVQLPIAQYPSIAPPTATRTPAVDAAASAGAWA